MYKIIGADGQEYGPVTAEQIRQWIGEGRANAQTRAQAEGSTDWKPLGDFPDFADALAAKAPPSAPPVFATGQPTGQPSGPTPDEILARDYDLEIGRCVSRGWDLLWQNFGIIFGITILFILISAALGGLGAIPFFGWFFTIVSLVVSGPLSGGLYLAYLKKIRGQEPEVGDLFAGFQARFVQLMLAYLVAALLTLFTMIPGGVLIAIAIVTLGLHGAGLGVAVLILGILLALIPAIYLGVSWTFAIPLVIDKGLDFWPAMQLSRRVVGKHWVSVFCLLIVMALFNLAGVLACCVGTLFSVPIAFGTLLHAYEDIFSDKTSQAA